MTGFEPIEQWSPVMAALQASMNETGIDQWRRPVPLQREIIRGTEGAVPRIGAKVLPGG
jgi:hypothetical protein